MDEIVKLHGLEDLINMKTCRKTCLFSRTKGMSAHQKFSGEDTHIKFCMLLSPTNRKS